MPRCPYGSPPHAWGILAVHVAPAVDRAGSPPHAWGIRDARPVVRFSHPVHPHTRGEYVLRVRIYESSMRFTPTRVGTYCIRSRRVERIDRFTPTRVGNTVSMLESSAAMARFTPTRVGTYVVPPSRDCRVAGSPPHAWGIRQPRLSQSADASVHPHTRGEYVSACSLRAACISVHPHTRGEYLMRWV